MRQTKGLKEELMHIKRTKVQPFRKVVLVRSMYTDAVYHLQISIHAHRGLFLVHVKETVGIPFITVESPNLRQAARVNCAFTPRRD